MPTVEDYLPTLAAPDSGDASLDTLFRALEEETDEDAVEQVIATLASRACIPEMLARFDAVTAGVGAIDQLSQQGPPVLAPKKKRPAKPKP